MKTRLFIGNLAPSVTEAELKDKFDKLLADHKDEAEVGSVEVKVKNEDNYFGYVDVHTKRPEGPGNSDIPQYLRKYIEIMNNTKWKGSLIKVQIAKESFMQKLMRERKEAKQEPVQPVASFQPKSTGPPTEISRNQKQASEVLHKLNLSKRRRRAPEEEENPEKNQFDFEVVNEKKTTKQTQNEKVDSVKVPVKTSPSPVKNKSKKKESSSESSDDDDEEEQRDVPKFKGLLFNFPNGITGSDPVASKNSDEEEPRNEEKTLKLKENEKKSSEKEELPKENGNTGQNLQESVPVPAKGITFKKNKQQQSDLLRIQSLEKSKELKEQQKNLIKSSLAKVPAVAPVTQKRKILNDEDSDEDDNPAQKKMSLFDDDDGSDDDGSDNDEDAFTVKKQFEGTSGQKLLELKTRWGNDSRFQIDDRFKEDDGKEVDADENEKEKQLNILTSIFGKEVGSKEVKKGPVKKNLAGVIAPRYDPEADNQEPEQEPEPVKKDEKPAETQEKVIRSVEPATYKTAANLKSLFSSETEKTPIFAEKPATFSLLRENSKGKEAKSGPEEEEGPRKFWEKNPFKYDSSDDENEELPKKEKEKPKQNLVVHGKTPFFFTIHDARFVDVEEFFLKNGISNGTEDSEGKKEPVEDFSVKRQELKSIVKAKIKNSKRKDEKRTLAIKRAMRKRKSKKMQTQRKF